MIRNRIAVGVAVAAFGVALTVGTAVADDLPGTGCSVPCPTTTTTAPSGEVMPNAEVNAPPAGGNASVLPATETNTATNGSPAVGSVAAASAVAPGVSAAAATSSTSGLPVTGGDIAGLTAVGLAAIGSGTVLVRRSRRRSA